MAEEGEVTPGRGRAKRSPTAQQPQDVEVAQNDGVGGAAPTVETFDLGPLDLFEPPFKEGPAKRVEQTRARLAVLLFWLLAAVVAALLALLYTERLKVQEFADVAAVLITPIVGLLGAATGYYYGRSDR